MSTHSPKCTALLRGAVIARVLCEAHADKLGTDWVISGPPAKPALGGENGARSAVIGR